MTGPDTCFRKMAEASTRKRGWKGEAGGRKGKEEALLYLMAREWLTGRQGVERTGRGGRILTELGRGVGCHLEFQLCTGVLLAEVSRTSKVQVWEVGLWVQRWPFAREGQHRCEKMDRGKSDGLGDHSNKPLREEGIANSQTQAEGHSTKYLP